MVGNLDEKILVLLRSLDHSRTVQSSDPQNMEDQNGIFVVDGELEFLHELLEETHKVLWLVARG